MKIKLNALIGTILLLIFILFSCSKPYIPPNNSNSKIHILEISNDYSGVVEYLLDKCTITKYIIREPVNTLSWKGRSYSKILIKEYALDVNPNIHEIMINFNGFSFGSVEHLKNPVKIPILISEKTNYFLVTFHFLKTGIYCFVLNKNQYNIFNKYLKFIEQDFNSDLNTFLLFSKKYKDFQLNVLEQSKKSVTSEENNKTVNKIQDLDDALTKIKTVFSNDELEFLFKFINNLVEQNPEIISSTYMSLYF